MLVAKLHQVCDRLVFIHFPFALQIDLVKMHGITLEDKQNSSVQNVILCLFPQISSGASKQTGNRHFASCKTTVDTTNLVKHISIALSSLNFELTINLQISRPCCF